MDRGWCLSISDSEPKRIGRGGRVWKVIFGHLREWVVILRKWGRGGGFVLSSMGFISLNIIIQIGLQGL